MLLTLLLSMLTKELSDYKSETKEKLRIDSGVFLCLQHFGNVIKIKKSLPKTYKGG